LDRGYDLKQLTLLVTNSFLRLVSNKELGNYINGNCLEIYFKTVLG